MGDVAKGSWVKIKSGVLYQGLDLSNKYGIVVDSESYIVVEIPSMETEQIKLLRTEIAEFLEGQPDTIFDDQNIWHFTF